MELADMQDLGSCAAGREGSSPSFRMNGRLFADKSLQRVFFYALTP